MWRLTAIAATTVIKRPWKVCSMCLHAKCWASFFFREFPQPTSSFVVTGLRSASGQRRAAFEAEPTVDTYVATRCDRLADAVQRGRGTGFEVVADHVGD